jgi:hypothetical protein
VGEETPKRRGIMGLDIMRYDLTRVEKKSRRYFDEKLHDLGYLRGGCHNDVYDELKLPNLFAIFSACTKYADPAKYDQDTAIIGKVEIIWEQIPKGLELARKTKCGLCRHAYKDDSGEMRVIDCAIEMLEDMWITRSGLYLTFVD